MNNLAPKQMNLSGSMCKNCSQHLQYLDAIKSSAKDLSLPIFETLIDAQAFDGRWRSYEAGRSYRFSCNRRSGGQHCLVSTDSGLEAFSRNPTDGSVAELAFQLTAFTKYLNEVFLSY